MVTRRNREFSDEVIARIADTYYAWRNKEGGYEDEKGFCKSATLDEVRKHNHVLTPGLYVGAAAVEADDTPFPERFAALRETLEEQFAEAEGLGTLIQAKLEKVVIDG